MRHAALFLLVGISLTGILLPQQLGPGPRRHHMDVHLEHVLRDRPARHCHRWLHHAHSPVGILRRRRRPCLHTQQPHAPDVEGVTRVMNALGGAPKIQMLLSGHSHFDHSFDTATWSRLTGARIIGPKTTCLQAEARKDSCSPVHCRFRQGEDQPGRGRHDACRALQSQRRSCGKCRATQSRGTGEGAGSRSRDRRTARRCCGGFSQRRRRSRISLHCRGAAGPASAGSSRIPRAPVDFSVPIVVDGTDYGAPDRESQGRDEGCRTGFGGSLDWNRRRCHRAAGRADHQAESLPSRALGWAVRLLSAPACPGPIPIVHSSNS